MRSIKVTTLKYWVIWRWRIVSKWTSLSSLRCQSLLHLRLYKLKRHELKECQKILNDHIQKASTQQQQSQHAPQLSPGGGPQQQQQPGISPTPSPAGSEGSVCSRSSGYTSSGEAANNGRGPPSPGGSAATGAAAVAGAAHHPPLMSVPQAVMQRQYTYCQYLSQCHELWEMADVYASRGKCSGGSEFNYLCLGLLLNFHLLLQSP